MKKIWKLIVSLVLALTCAMPADMLSVFALESEIIVDDVQTSGTHYFTYSDATDANGLTGWAADTKDAIQGEVHAKTQHWVWNRDYSEAAKHTYTFTFEGTGVEIWGVKNDAFNTFQLDDEAPVKTAINGAANTPVVLYSRKDLTPGRHVVKASLSEGGTGLQVSFAKVFGTVSENPENEILKITPDQQSGPTNKFVYHAPAGKQWAANVSEAYIDLKSDGSLANECYYEIPFNGNGIEVFANKNRNHGMVKFSVDGKEEQLVDLYSATRTTPLSVYRIENLEEGDHTLKAVLHTEKNAASTTFVNQVAYAQISHAPYTIEDIVLNETSYTLSEGATRQIDYTLQPVYVSISDLAFTSSDENVATVSETGLIQAVSAGQTMIAVEGKANGIRKEISVVVEEAKPDLGGSIVDVFTHYTQDRYEEVKSLGTLSKQLTAWKNDHAISEISLYTKDCALKNVSVSVSDLTNETHTIAKENVTATFIKSVKAYNGTYLGYGSKDREIPADNGRNRSESNDVLYEEGPVSIGYNKLQNIWMDFSIPKDAPAGEYHATVTVKADGIEAPLEFTYTITVQDALLNDAETFKDTFDIELWQYPYSSAEYYGVEPFSPEHLELMKSSMLKYKEIGGHAITTTIVEEAWNGQTYSANEVHYPSMVKWTKNADGTFSYDYTHFDKWVQFNKDLGIGDKIVLYSIAPWHQSFTYWENDQLVYEKYTVGSERYNKVWGDFLRDLINHLMEKGWFDESYVGIDERGFDARAFDLIDSIKNIHDEPLKTAGAMDGFVNKPALALRVTDLNVGDNAAQAHLTEFNKLVKDREAKGYRTTLYSCTEHQPGNFSLSAPVESYWSIINAGKQNTVGFLRWAYDAWVKDPLRDATHNSFEAGDTFLIYPDEKDAENKTSKSSVRLEMMAAGVRDVNKLMQMESEIASLTSEIDALYNNITMTAKTSRECLPKDQVRQLSEETKAFQEGLAALTERYIQIKETGTTVVESVEIEGGNREIMLGNSVQLSAVVKPENLINKEVTWSSSNEAVAIVDEQGVVTARSLGTTVINAVSKQDPSKHAAVEVRVNAVSVEESAQVSYYSFDHEEEGKVSDAWSAKRNGINHGSIAKGKSGDALYITEAGQGVVLDGTSSIGNADAWTIGYWVNTDAVFDKEISVTSDANKDFATSLKMSADRDSGFRVGKRSGDVLTFAYNFSANNWYHVAWTQSKTDGLTMYVNGQRVTNNAWTKTNTVKIPMDLIGGNGFTGLIDEVKVYNRVLNAEEIASTMVVKGLNVPETYKKVYVNDTCNIEAQLISDEEDKTISYTSNNPAIASVDETGKVTAHKRGVAIITVENKASGYKEEVTIEVSKRLTISNALETYKLPDNRLSTIERAPGTDRQYLGQPDMVRTSTGRLITAYPKGHGKGPIIMQISDDEGKTWRELEGTPASWIGSQETPTMYVLKLADGTERIMMITACPGWGSDSNGNTHGWNTSYSDNNGETWSEYAHWYSTRAHDKANNDVIVGMASLVQLKDAEGNFIQKWMGVYHTYGYVNYKTYLTFDEEGNEQWSEPVPYLSDYRDIESTYKMCEIGMFRSPDGKTIVGLARSQSHNNPATLIYSNDEGETWSKPMDLPGSLAGERHKAVYDPISGRLVISFREIKYDLNNDNQFGGNADWTCGEWVAWVGTYEDLMEQNDGQYMIQIEEDWANNAKSGDTGYAGVVVLDDGTFIMDSYGHWDKDFSLSWTGGVTTDLCYIKQAKFKLSEMDNVAGLINRDEIHTVIDEFETLNKEDYTTDSWAIAEKAYKDAMSAVENVESTQKELDTAADALLDAISKLQNKDEPVVDKTALSIAVEEAEAVSEEQLDKVVPVVAEEFRKALAEAKTILADENATQVDVDASFTRLASVIQMLDFVKGDKTDLQALVDAIAELNKEDFTADSWKALEEALKEAKDVIADENALEKEVVDAYNKLNEAFTSLEHRADKARLQALVDKMNGLDESKYIKSTWDAMVVTLTQAQKVLDNKEATQAEVDAAYEGLLRGYLGLRFVPDKGMLEDLINKVENLTAQDFTKVSWDALATALKEAKEVNANEKATAKEIETAYSALNDAYAGLDKVDVTKPGDNGSDNETNHGTGNGTNTGDTSNRAAMTGLMLLAGAVLVVRKRTSK